MGNEMIQQRKELGAWSFELVRWNCIGLNIFVRSLAMIDTHTANALAV